MLKKLSSIAILLALGQALQSQSSAPLPVGEYAYPIIDRLDIKGGQNSPFQHTALKPYVRAELGPIRNAEFEPGFLESKRNLKDIDYLSADNADYPANNLPALSKKPILKYFYRTPAHFLELRKKPFSFALDPIINVQGGFGQGTSDGRAVFLNQRGGIIRGDVDGKVYFYMRLLETQAGFPEYVQDYIGKQSAIPGAGYWKRYDSRLTDNNNDGYDYFQGQGLIGFNVTKHVGVQFGHGRNFIGDGHRSLFLSDFSNDYFYLKLNTKVWKFHYQNLFAELTQDYIRGGDKLLPKKYLAAHYLSFDILKNLNVGLFEGVMFSRDNGFELQYLNPLIFYRTVEHQLGSPDNVILGASVKYNFLKRFQVYGQFVLDEFSFKEAFAGTGWWANKYGIQAGVKYIDAFGLDHLDLQVEFNSVRPYTYTHRDSSANYTHYNQALAHPLGANFNEVIAKVRYQPIPSLTLNAQLNFAKQGLDTLDSHWGSNIHIPSSYREQDFDNSIAQGVSANTIWAGLNASWQFKHNMFVDANFVYRKRDAALDVLDRNDMIISLGLRLNIANRLNDF